MERVAATMARIGTMVRRQMDQNSIRTKPGNHYPDAPGADPAADRGAAAEPSGGLRGWAARFLQGLAQKMGGAEGGKRHAEIVRLTNSFNLLVTQMQERGEETRASEQRFRELAESIGAVFWLTDVNKKRMIYVSQGYEKIWGRSCASLYENARDWFEAVHAEDRQRIGEALARQKTGGYDEEFRIVRPDAEVRWIHDRAFPVRNETGEVYRIAGIAEDISERKQLQKEVTEISDREQRRLGLDLHDGICQQLVSVAFAADILRKDLMVKSPPDALRLARITGLLDNAIMQARTLSQALYPVNLVGSGLGFALRELANRTGQGRQFVCQADCDDSVTIANHALATHLYHIAQEAVQNAAQHASPFHITISLARQGDNVCLTIMDDGITVDEERKFGFGLSIMRYRAGMAGGRLEIRKGAAGGTVVSVSVKTELPDAPPSAESFLDGETQPSSKDPMPRSGV
jgi:PAS domain S-box-containing protein